MDQKPVTKVIQTTEKKQDQKPVTKVIQTIRKTKSYVFISFTVELGKRIFATVKPRFTSTELIIQYSYLHSNTILNIKMYSFISLGLNITQIKIPWNIVDDFGT
jgi:hypothetical protein